MGWQAADELDGREHEGYAVAVLGDGTEPDPIQVPLAGGQGTTPNSSWWNYNGKDGRPRAVAVRAGCSCGWRSKEMFPVDFSDEDATEGFVDDTGPFAAWDRQHIAPLQGSTVPDPVREAITALRCSLNDLIGSRPLAATAAAAQVEKMGTAVLQRAVPAATDAGHTWEEVGTALGVTRQAAHGRFSKASLVVDRQSAGGRSTFGFDPQGDVATWAPDYDSPRVQAMLRKAQTAGETNDEAT